MADPVIPVHRLNCGDEHFDLSGLMSDEMVQVKAWTTLKNRREFYQALQDEDPDAITAAFALVRWRATGEKPKWSDVRVNLDELRWSRHVDGREVELVMERRDGQPLIVVVDKKGEPVKEGDGFKEPTGEDGELTSFVLLRDAEGNLRWQFTDTSEDVRPTTQPATDGSTGSPSTATKPARSGSGSGTPTTSAA